MYPELFLYINGEFIGVGGQRKSEDVTNPATREVLGRLPHATIADLAHAVATSQSAFLKWRKSSPLQRSEILRRAASLARERADDIAQAITLDQGKPLAEARAEVVTCADHADWHAEECRRIYGRVIPPRDTAVRQIPLRERIWRQRLGPAA